MAITLEKFAADCHAALKSQPGTPGREKVRDLVKQVLADPAFVARYIPPARRSGKCCTRTPNWDLRFWRTETIL